MRHRQGTAVLKMGKRRFGNRIRGGFFLGLLALSSLSLGFAAWVVPIQGVAQDVGLEASFGATSTLSFLRFGTPEVPYVYQDSSSSCFVIKEDSFEESSLIRVPFVIDHRLAHAGGYVDEENAVRLRFSLEGPTSLEGIDNPPVARSNVSTYLFSASSFGENALVSEGSVSLLSDQAAGESSYTLEYTVHDEAARILLEGGISLEAYAL